MAKPSRDAVCTNCTIVQIWKIVQFGQVCTIWTSVYNMDKCVQFEQVYKLENLKFGQVYNLGRCTIWTSVQFGQVYNFVKCSI